MVGCGWATIRWSAIVGCANRSADHFWGAVQPSTIRGREPLNPWRRASLVSPHAPKRRTPPEADRFIFNDPQRWCAPRTWSSTAIPRLADEVAAHAFCSPARYSPELRKWRRVSPRGSKALNRPMATKHDCVSRLPAARLPATASRRVCTPVPEAASHTVTTAVPWVRLDGEAALGTAPNPSRSCPKRANF